MKNKLIMVGAMAFLSIGSLASCQNGNNSNTSSVESSSNSTTSSVTPLVPADLIYIDPIDALQYGASLDISSKVHIGGTFYGYIAIVCTSLTPDVVTIDSTKPSVIIATGVGDAKVSVNVGGAEKIVEFKTVPSIRSIEITNPSEDFLLNQLISLDDYVKVNVANPIGAKSDYVATASRDSRDIVDIQGHMVKFKATGDFTILIQDTAKTKSAYFKGCVTSTLQKTISNYAKKITNNYTNVLAGNIITVHTDNYVFYPMKKLLSTNWEYNGLANMEYEGYVEFSDKTVYHVVAGQNADNYPDINNMKFISKISGSKETIWNFDPINWNILKEFKTHTSSDGIEDYLYATASSTILDELIGTTYGIVLGSGAVDEVRLTYDENAENNKLTVSFYLDDKLSFTERFWDVDASAYSPIDTFVADVNNKPAPINTTPVVEKLQEIINSKNFTVTGRSYISDPNGNEMEYADAIAAYLPLHTMYYTGGARYTENAMFVRNVQAFEVEGNTDKQKSHGYVNKDGKVYEVNFEKDSRGNEIYGGEMTLDSSPVVNSNGQQISFYGDNTSFKSLYRLNFDHWSELDFLSENENTYEFTIGQKSKNGSELLRNILNTSIPEFTESIFPSNLYNNSFEAASAGQGIFKLNENGDLYFAYQVANIISEINLSIRLSVELTFSNIGTTTISEFDALM